MIRPTRSLRGGITDATLLEENKDSKKAMEVGRGPVGLPSMLRGVPHPAPPPVTEAMLTSTVSTSAPTMTACDKRKPPQLLVVRRYFFISFLVHLVGQSSSVSQ